MGKQIRFIILNEEEINFIHFVQNIAKLVDEKNNCLNENEFEKPAIYKKEPFNIPTLLQAYILNPDANLYIEENGFIDELKSDVVKYSRSIMDIKSDKIVNPGRIWAEFRYYDECYQLISKAKPFNDLFESCRKWVKKHLLISNDKNYYIGKKTLVYCKENGYKIMASPKYEVIFP